MPINTWNFLIDLMMNLVLDAELERVKIDGYYFQTVEPCAQSVITGRIVNL